MRILKSCWVVRFIYVTALLLVFTGTFAVIGAEQDKSWEYKFTQQDMAWSAPYLFYPDVQDMTDVTGNITAIYKAHGSNSFRYEEADGVADLLVNVKLNVTMTVKYTRVGQKEQIYSSVHGTKTMTEYQKAWGRNPETNPYSSGYSYSPEMRRTTRETYSGTAVQQYPGSAVPKLFWSKKLRLACFQANIGDQPSGWPSFFIGVPVKVSYERKTTYDGETAEHEVNEFETMFSAPVPSRGTSGSKWAGAINADIVPGASELNGGWLESASPQGTVGGSYSVPMFFTGLKWVTEGAAKVSGNDPRRKPEYDLEIQYWPGSIQVTWALGSKIPQGEMVIIPEAEEYQKWIPAPVDDDRFSPGETIRFTARIKPKEKGKPAPKGKIDFWLTDVSQEKGICTNYPVNGKGEDDLRFVSDQKGIIIDPNNPRHATTEEACSEATIEIEALDTGAYGMLQATCEELGLIAEDERTKRQAIAIPIDDNHNMISDAWEQQKGIYNLDYLAYDDDDSQPSGQRRSGDGYTVYEEYRGFMTKSGFVRTEPGKKDLFVYDPDDLVKKHYEPYNPAQLELQYVDPTMMKFTGGAEDSSNRCVNTNTSGDKSYARQYALFVKQWPTMSGGTIGEANWHTLADQLNGIADPYEGFEQPLKKIYIIKIAPGTLEKCLAGIKDSTVRQDVFRKMLTSSVIHEIGHGLGIPHHKEGEMETDETILSGVFDCSMRYTTQSEYEHPELLKLQVRYCREGETWRETVDGKFQERPAHNCFGQIDVKSDP